MDLKFLILLSILCTLCESGCPSTCKCSDFAVLCVNKDLESIPSFESLTVFPAILDLSGNKITMIDNDDLTFDNSYAVEEIYLNNSEILDIESDAFDEMENLQELYLGENLLNSLPEDIIEDLPNMILLDISSNHFSGDMPTIRSNSLEVLAIANSKITNVPEDSLKFLPNLKLLLLQQNNLKFISPYVFQYFTNKSFFVRLSYNIWECNCQTLELFRYLADKEFIDSTEPYQCTKTNSDEYMDIYGEDARQMYFETCAYNLLKDGSPRKKQLDKEPEQIERQNDKSFSLIKENNTDVNNGFDKDNDATHEGKSIDIIDKDEGDKSDNNVLIIKTCETTETIFVMFGIPFTLVAIIIIIISFLIGIVIGYCINIAVVKSFERRYEISESRSKLLNTAY